MPGMRGTSVQKKSWSEYRREWRRLNPEKCRAQEKRYRERHREAYLAKLRAYSRKYYETNLRRYRARAAELRAQNPLYMKEYHLQKKYGLTLVEYQALEAVQGGLCAVCCEPETLAQKGRRLALAVDHDHATGKVRGLLCSACNMALGKLKEDPARIRALAQYVEAYACPVSA